MVSFSSLFKVFMSSFSCCWKLFVWVWGLNSMFLIRFMIAFSNSFSSSITGGTFLDLKPCVSVVFGLCYYSDVYWLAQLMMVFLPSHVDSLDILCYIVLPDWSLLCGLLTVSTPSWLLCLPFIVSARRLLACGNVYCELCWSLISTHAMMLTGIITREAIKWKAPHVRYLE